MQYKNHYIKDDYLMSHEQVLPVFSEHVGSFALEDMRTFLAKMEEQEKLLNKAGIKHTDLAMDLFDDEDNMTRDLNIVWFVQETEREHSARIEREMKSIDRVVDYELEKAKKVIEEHGGRVVFFK